MRARLGNVGADTGRSFRIIALAVTLGGIFIFGAFIALFATGVQARLAELRKGRTFVADPGHAAILGWSQRIFLIVSELVIANGNLKGSVIVVLAERECLAAASCCRPIPSSPTSRRRPAGSPGLLAVYTELLNFERNEVYFRDEPRLRGKTYGEALHPSTASPCYARMAICTNPPWTYWLVSTTAFRPAAS